MSCLFAGAYTGRYDCDDSGRRSLAPSPMNAQPWEFIVIANEQIKKDVFSETETLRQDLLRKSGWKWLGKYNFDFLISAPVIVAVVEDPDKTGADKFIEDGGRGYRDACAAVVQNMLLAAHALGLGSLWFTLFDPKVMRKLLDVESNKTVVALVCLGKPAGEPLPSGRNDAPKRTRFIR